MNHRRTPLLLLSLALLLPASCSTGASTQTYDSALQAVLDQVVQPDTLDQPVLVFGLVEPLQPGDQIGPYSKEGYGDPVAPTVIDEESWFFWVDDDPGAKFVHPSRFVLVSAGSGEVTVSEQEWWPVLNGDGLWTESEEYWNEANWAFSNLAEGPPAGREPSEAKSLAALAGSGGRQSASPGAAIVINGWSSGETGKDEFEIDANGMHDLLTESGFDVTYLGPAEDGNADRDEVSDAASRSQWFTEKAGQMRPSETLVVYITGHGTVLKDGTAIAGPIFEDGLAEQLKKFDPGVHIIVIVDSCHSGGFADGMRPVADVTVMSTSADRPSYFDLDKSRFDGWIVTDPNPDDQGSEFTSGFREDWQEITGDPQTRAAAEAAAVQNGHNLWEELTALSFASALAKDVAALTGKTAPNIVLGEGSTVLVDALNDGLNCVTGAPLETAAPESIDIWRAVAEVLFGETSAEPEQVRFTIELSAAPPPTTSLFGGIEFADPSTPISPLNPRWYFDGIGNRNFSFEIRGETVVPTLHQFDPSRGWAPNPNTGFFVEIDGKRIFITVPVAEIPANSPWYASVTDFTACDAVGVSEDRTPSGRLPIWFDPLAPILTPPSP